MQMSSRFRTEALYGVLTLASRGKDGTTSVRQDRTAVRHDHILVFLVKTADVPC